MTVPGDGGNIILMGRSTDTVRPLRLCPPPLTAVLFIVALFWSVPALADDDVPFPQLEEKMLEMVNEDRAEHGLGPLEQHDCLADVARAHSRDMQQNNFFAHRSPTTGMVKDRLWEAEVRVQTAAENIARNRSLQRAQADLMNSPSHRAAILDPNLTHCGIGVVKNDTDQYVITQVFALPAPEIDIERAGAELLEKLNEARAEQNQPACRASGGLDKIAAAHAAELAEAGEQVPLDLPAKVRAAGLQYRRLSTARVILWDPMQLAEADALVRTAASHLGFGFAKNTKHRHLGYGSVWVVVIMAGN